MSNFEKIGKNKVVWCTNCDIAVDISKRKCSRCGTLLNKSDSKKNKKRIKIDLFDMFSNNIMRA